MTDDGGGRRDLPTGTVTFLRTDVEGSMRLVRTLGPAWERINEAHLDILRDAVAAHGGVVVRTEGDALFAAFPEAGAAVRAAIEGQRALDVHPWPAGAEVRVRMGLHSGEAHLAGDDYGGFEVNRAARIAAVGNGGQIVVSGTTHALVQNSLTADSTFRDLGRHALKDVPTPESLFQLDVIGRRTDFPPLRVSEQALGNLPERLTSFVGRAADLDELDGLVDRHRFVTLVGPGGIGKTSLAIEAARRRAGSLPDGAWFVALDAVTDPDLVGSAIARSLGLFDGVARPAANALPSFLADRSLILVLDNFEHLLDAAETVATLVRVSPASLILVTSRAPLHLGGEREYPVRPLSVSGVEPTADATIPDASARLFVDRARAVRRDWDPAPDLPVVAEICALLDGLPLGIELAAARMSLLPASAIRDRLAARLPLPGMGQRDAPARQRTLEAAIGWSHDLLSPAEQRILRALAVFEGGFDVDQVDLVVDDRGDAAGESSLEGLLALGEHSLIAPDRRQGDDAARLAGSGIRFGMLGTVQGFALGRLIADGREGDVRRRHAIAYCQLAEVGAGHLFASGQPPWIDRLAMDDPNLQAALRWAIAAGETELALRLVAALWRYWQLVGRLGEGAELVNAALAMPGADAPTPSRLAALAAAGSIAYWRSEREVAVERYRGQLALAERLRDTAAMADACFNLAAATYVIGERDQAIRNGGEARRLYAELGDERGVNRVDWGMSRMILDQRGPAAMIEAVRPVLERAVALDDAPYVVLCGGSLAWANFMLGDTASGARWGIHSMLSSYGMRDVAGSTIALPVAATVAIEYGHPEDAAFIVGAFEALCERYGVRPPLGLEELIRRLDPAVRLQTILDPAPLAAALERGRRMSLDEVMDIVVRIGDLVPSSGGSG
jgi:predicted ATPase/class 3 adenylate cyclase